MGGPGSGCWYWRRKAPAVEWCRHLDVNQWARQEAFGAAHADTPADLLSRRLMGSDRPGRGLAGWPTACGSNVSAQAPGGERLAYALRAGHS